MGVIDAAKDVGQAILNFLKEVWNFIKRKIHDLIVSFKKIVAYFKEPDKLEKIERDKEMLAIVIKEGLDNGEYNVVECLYNSRIRDVVDYQETQIFENARELDKETQGKFGDKNMIVLR